MFRKIAVGISGGVDSAVSAYLLKNKGFEVTGVFMKNWDIIDETGICSIQKDLTDAKLVCDKLKIPFIEVNFIKNYWNEVFINLIKDYENGWTPNPDILCNRHIKFKAFYEYCLNTLKVDAIATGHYANTSFGPYLEKYVVNQDASLLIPVDSYKDQTFFLAQIKQEPLRKTMFPVGLLNKTEVRSIAQKQGLLNVANKKDSVGICFVGKRNFQEFISEYIPPKPGIFVDIDTGLQVGTHNGIHQWTIGQRAKIGGMSDAYFVARKNLNNVIYVALGTHHPSLFTRVIFCDPPHWIRREPEPLNNNGVLECYFRFQHIHPLTKCKIMKTHNGVVIILDKPLRAITPGQFAALYIQNECIGSGRITGFGPTEDILMLNNDNEQQMENQFEAI